ncbi:unnamed protein product, partial [Rotaria sordida]
EKQQTIINEPETNFAIIREQICSMFQTNIALDKFVKVITQVQLRPEQEMELCKIILNMCAEQHTYKCSFGLLGEELCEARKEYVQHFEKIFQDQYEIAHSLENMKLKNVAKFFAHLLRTNAISWRVLDSIDLTKEDKTSPSSIYIKSLFSQIIESLNETQIVLLRELVAEFILTDNSSNPTTSLLRSVCHDNRVSRTRKEYDIETSPVEIFVNLLLYNKEVLDFCVYTNVESERKCLTGHSIQIWSMFHRQ